MKNVLITGVSTGIGKTTAIEMAKNGYRVFAGVRQENDVKILENEKIQNLIPIILDVTKENDTNNTLTLLEKSCGENGLFALVNNAGINYIAPFEVSDEQKVRSLMEVNFFGLYNLTKKFIPLLQKFAKKNPNETAKIFNIGSIGSAIGLPWEFSYHASKFAVLGLSQSLRFELEHLGIKVTCIMPGGVKTEIFDKSIATAQHAKEELTGENQNFYAKNLEKMSSAASNFKNMAIPPKKVADVIMQLAKKRNPPLRKLVGLDAKIINFLVWLGLEGLLKGQFVTKL